jgi:hypothetical protein
MIRGSFLLPAKFEGDSAQCAGQEPTFLRGQIGAALNHLV